MTACQVPIKLVGRTSHLAVCTSQPTTEQTWSGVGRKALQQIAQIRMGICWFRVHLFRHQQRLRQGPFMWNSLSGLMVALRENKYLRTKSARAPLHQLGTTPLNSIPCSLHFRGILEVAVGSLGRTASFIIYIKPALGANIFIPYAWLDDETQRLQDSGNTRSGSKPECIRDNDIVVTKVRIVGDGHSKVQMGIERNGNVMWANSDENSWLFLNWQCSSFSFAASPWLNGNSVVVLQTTA